MAAKAKQGIQSGSMFDAKALAQSVINFGTTVTENGLVAKMNASDNKAVTRFQQAVNKAKVTSQGNVGLSDIVSYLELYAKSNLPQYMMSDFLGASKGTSVKAANFRDMLPKAFANISTQKSNIASSASLAQGEKLTQSEVDNLVKIIQGNTYLADAAVRQGVARKSNGRIYINPNVHRAQVNAMSGDIFQDFVVGARGAGQYGIRDVEDPDMFYKIIRKQNKRILGAREAAWTMQDMFEWLNPIYGAPVENTRNRNVSGWRSAGAIRQSPKQTAYEYAMYDIDKLPTDFSYNRNQSTTNPDGSPKSAADYNRIMFNNSLYRAMVHRLAGEDMQHNDYSDTFMYMKLPQEMARKLGDTRVAK